MAVVIQMPKLGHTMTEGTIVRWHKCQGDAVREGEPVLTVETDKAEVEIEALSSGILAKCVAEEGAIVPVGGALAIITQPGEEAPADLPVDASPEPFDRTATSASAPSRAVQGATRRGRAPASPRAKRLAAELGIDVASVAGTGPDGLVTEDDVRRAAASAAPGETRRPAAAPVQGVAQAPLAPARIEKLTRIQQVGARNLTQSWQQVPHFVQMVRVDMSRALEARKALAADGQRVSITDVVLAAAVSALKDNPRINAAYRDGELHIYDRINLGVAVDTPDGLIVPVIHGAHALDVFELSRRASELAERARAKKLRPTDLENATFTVSNLGAYGVETGTPVIFTPQLALMFVGAIRDEVVAVDGRPEVRPVMQIAIAYDHRGADGATASRFTTRVKELLERAEFLRARSTPATGAPARLREVVVDAAGDSLRTENRQGAIRWTLSAESDAAPDPVTAFLGALASCLLMSLRVAARARKLNLGRSSVIARANERGHVKAIEVELRVESREDDDTLHQLVERAERGCHVRALISDDVPVKLSVARM
jgi:pyruvate dehydrogenase E2 component (dihydrolipoamide acetyltransferase)